MMRADLSTDTLIRLMREVFAEETLAFERRARIHARITANPSAQGMELWANPATPFDEPSVEDITEESDQLWLFPDYEAPVPPIESTMSLLRDGSSI